MIRKLLSFGGVTLLTTAFLEPLFFSGIGKPVPWLRDLLMAVGGVACLFVLVKFRKDL
jgi:hypothetical protein